MGEDNDKLLDPTGTMSLGDHLEELRLRLILALGGLAIGLVVCLVFGRQIIGFIQRPYVQVLSQSAGSANPTEDPNAPAAASTSAPKPKPTLKLQTLAPADGIIAYIKISLIAGLIVSSPWVFYQTWLFIAAGLYPHEKRFVHLAAPFSAILFVSGALFFIFVVAPLTLRFLIGFNAKVLNVESNFTFSYYISFVCMLTLVFGLAFQMPIAIYFLTRTGLVSIAALRSSRKFVLLAIVVVAAMATPPDVVSQVTLAIPLYMLFELGIVLSLWAQRRDQRESSVDT